MGEANTGYPGGHGVSVSKLSTAKLRRGSPHVARDQSIGPSQGQAQIPIFPQWILLLEGSRHHSKRTAMATPNWWPDGALFQNKFHGRSRRLENYEPPRVGRAASGYILPTPARLGASLRGFKLEETAK